MQNVGVLYTKRREACQVDKHKIGVDGDKEIFLSYKAYRKSIEAYIYNGRGWWRDEALSNNDHGMCAVA